MVILAASAWAGKYHTDHNLPDLDWNTVETEHFAFHYPSGGKRDLSAEHSVRALATAADDVWWELCEQLGFFVDETVHVVVVEQADELVGFAVPAWDWIVISPQSGPEVWRMRGRQEWLSDVLAHEFGHVVALKRAAAMAEDVDFGVEIGVKVGSLGGGAEITEHRPWWWSEGGAEAWSDRAGFNYWGDARDAYLRTTVLDDRLLSWDEWTSRRGKTDWGDGERGYLQGYAFSLWLEDRFGRDVYVDLADAWERRWRIDPDAVLHEVTGTPGRVLFGAFQLDLAKRYEPVLAELEASGRAEGRQLESYETEVRTLWDRDRRDRKPVRQQEDDREATGTFDLWPTNAHGWHAENRNGWLHVLQADSAVFDPTADQEWPRDAPRTWLPMARGQRFALVPGGDEVVVVREERPGFGKGYAMLQLHRVDLRPDVRRRKHRGGKEEAPTYKGNDDRRYTPIEGTLRARDPAISPAGTLAFVRYGDAGTELVVGPLDGEHEQRTSFGDGSIVQSPSFGPADALVVSLTRHDQTNLWRVDGDVWTPLTWGAADAQDAHWGSDGWVYFSGDAGGTYDIYRVHPEDGRVEQVTAVLGMAATPSITERGDLYYSHFTAHGWKSMFLSREQFLYRPTDAFAVPADLDTDAFLAARPTEPLAAERYRPRFLPWVGAPEIRLDGERLLSGGYVQRKDALERHTLGVEVLIGEDQILRGHYTWRGWSPDVTLWGYDFVDNDGVGAGAGGLSVSQQVLEDVQLGGFVTGATVPSQVDSARAGLRVTAGDGDLIDAGYHGVVSKFTGTVGTSDSASLGAYRWARLESSLRADTRFSLWSGMRRKRHSLEWGGTAGLTSRGVDPAEALRGGGAHPRLLAAGRIESTAPFASLPAYSVAGQHLVTAHVGWRFPLAQEIRRKLGPFYVEGLHGALSTGVLAAAPSGEVRYQVEADLRLRALFLGQRWNTLVRVATSPPSNPRLTLAVGVPF